MKKEIEQFHQYQQNEQSRLTTNHWLFKKKRKKKRPGVGNPDRYKKRL